MSNGVPILDTITRKCVVEKISKNTFRIILTQGLNRQIRRMCEHLGYDVIRLKRIRIMNISLDTKKGGLEASYPKKIFFSAIRFESSAYRFL